MKNNICLYDTLKIRNYKQRNSQLFLRIPRVQHTHTHTRITVLKRCAGELPRISTGDIHCISPSARSSGPRMLQLYNWANNLFWRPTGAIGIARWHFLVTHSRALASLALPLSLCHSRSIYLSLLVSLHILATRARARACSTGTRRRARAALARALDRKCETPVAAKLNVQLIDGGARTHALPACRARFYFRVMFCA